MVAGTQGVALNGNVQNTFTNFAPRGGIAYQVTPKTVIRMGYGRSFDIGVFGATFGHSVTQNLPVLAQQRDTTANNYNRVWNLAQGPQAVDPASALLNNCNDITDPDGSIRAGGGQCLGPNGFPLLPNGITSFVLPAKMRLPTVDAWNVTVQHQLTPSIALEAAYVANKGTHVFADDGPDYDFNSPTLEGFAAGVDSNSRKYFYNKFGWTQNFHYFGDDGTNRYNSLQVKAEKRFSGSYSLMGYYTLQQSLNNGGSYYNVDKHLDWGRTDMYSTNVVVVTNMWELPVGRGRHYLSGAGRALDYLVGGWEITQGTTFYSGLPFNVSYRDCGADLDVGPCRPNVVGTILQPHDQNLWFQVVPGTVGLDTNGAQSGPWQRPNVGEFGNLGRNQLIGPGLFNTDFSVLKNFQITERFKGQFRAEAFNLFNIVNLGNPDGCVDCDPNNAGTIHGLRAGAQMRRFQFALRFEF